MGIKVVVGSTHLVRDYSLDDEHDNGYCTGVFEAEVVGTATAEELMVKDVCISRGRDCMCRVVFHLQARTKTAMKLSS